MPNPSKPSKAAAIGRDGNALVVTSQQSRFHADAVDTPTSKDIDVKGVTLTVGGRELLDRAHLRIKDGVHYVLAGRNGTGKSSLLRALAERRVTGVPSNLRLLLLGQTRIDSDVSTNAIEPEDHRRQTVLEHVTRSDQRRERALRISNRLTTVLEDKQEARQIVETVHALQLDQAKQELAEAQLTAERRSGARGAKARQTLIQKERVLEEAQKRLAESDVQDEDEAIKTAIDMLEATHLELEAMDAGSTESRARIILLGLRFSEAQIEQPFTSLSGGWRTRCDLASALIQKTDVLMLDEPTNFLDLPAIIWLQRYIETSLASTSVIVVTHDRDFADAVAQELLLVRISPAKTLELFKGNLTEYENKKRRQIRRMTKISEAQEKKTKHMEAAVMKNIQAAKRTGDDKKLKQAVSRKKKIEERSGLEVGQHGGRFKLNRDLVGYHLTNRAEIEIPEFDPPITITLPDQPSSLRHAGPLFSVEKVSFKYPKSLVWTLQDVDLVLHPGERIGLAGLNGSGKSTLVNLLMGAATGGSDPRPTKGAITVHSNARFACYSQHAVETLESIGLQTPERTALSHLTQLSDWNGDEQAARVLLARLGLRGNFVADVPLHALSGGQRVRLALAEALLNSPHLLVLDEVTTHLDADTIDALIEAFADWQGALVVITHDRHFMRCVIGRERISRGGDDDDDDDDDDESSDDRRYGNRSGSGSGGARAPGTVYHVRKAGLRKLERGMQQYEEFVSKSVAKLAI